MTAAVAAIGAANGDSAAVVTGDGGIRITLAVCVGPREVREHQMHLPLGATVQDALEAARGCGWLTDDQALPEAGIWGRVVEAATALAEDDRLEVYRPLQVDPKVARRERFARQGARSTGLFARQRPGGKAGY